MTALEFQCVSWYAKDVPLCDDSDSDEDGEAEKKYRISTKQTNSISIAI